MDLIAAAYGDDSDEVDDSDPWSFSKVSTKRTLKEEDERPLKKQNKLPPPRLSGKVNEDTAVIDDPAVHGNRVRSFPHERGNWASFVHLPWEATDEFISFVHLLCHEFEKKHNIKLDICDDFHISLTRTIVLRHHWIEGFVASVRKQLEDIKSFPVHLSDLEVYVNEEKTRTFLAFRVSDASNNLDVLVQRMDHCMREYQLPEFYKDPAHHVSFAWCLGDRKEELNLILASGLVTLPSQVDVSWCMASQVRCKISQMTFVCNLKSS